MGNPDTHRPFKPWRNNPSSDGSTCMKLDNGQSIFVTCLKLIISILSLAMLCAGCTRSKAVDHGAQSPRQSPRYNTDSQTKSPQANFGGRVVAVEDGDTIVALTIVMGHTKSAFKALMHQKVGRRLEKGPIRILVKWFLESRSTLNGLSVIGIGESSGKVLAEGNDVSLQQIKAGMAWHCKYYQDEQSATDRELYANAENEAHSARLGPWSDDNPIPSWQFRRGH